MEATNEKLQRFIDAVNNEIDEKVSALLDEAEAEKRRIIKEAKAESESTAEKHIASNIKKSDNRYVREISKAELNMKREVLKHREELTDKVFAVVEKRISEYRDTSAYVDFLIKTLSLLNVGDESEIRLSPNDMKYADTLKKAIKSDSAEFVQDDTIKLGGLSVYSKNKGTIIDKTFDLAVEEQKNVFVGSNAFAK